jgi:hypothetical protein
LTEFELKIAATMIHDASLEWEKIPSEKQLKWVASILDKYGKRASS